MKNIKSRKKIGQNKDPAVIVQSKLGLSGWGYQKGEGGLIKEKKKVDFKIRFW